MEMKFDIPHELDYFTLGEVALQWECEESDIERLVFEDQTLRVALVTDLCEDFYWFGEPEWWRCIFTRQESDEDHKSLVDKQESGVILARQEHDVLRTLVKSKWWIGRELLPLSELPQFLYLDMVNSSQTRGNKYFELFEEVQFKRGDKFEMNSVLSFDGQHIDFMYYVEGDENKVSGMELTGENFIIPREERDRFMSGQSVGAMADVRKQNRLGNSAAVEATALDGRVRNNLLRVIKAMTMAIGKNTEEKFSKAGVIDYSGLSVHLWNFGAGSHLSATEIEAKISGCFDSYDIEVTEKESQKRLDR